MYSFCIALAGSMITPLPCPSYIIYNTIVAGALKLTSEQCDNKESDLTVLQFHQGEHCLFIMKYPVGTWYRICVGSLGLLLSY